MNSPKDVFPVRKNIRLSGYDYSSEGLYFITICTHNHEPKFGYISNGIMILNEIGDVASMEWLKLQERYSSVQLLDFVVMPNHMHGIIMLEGGNLTEMMDVEGRATARVAPTVGMIVGAYKSLVVNSCLKRYKKMNIIHSVSRMGDLWQRNYFEHIIRSEISLGVISRYIKNNPVNWEKDCFAEAGSVYPDAKID